MPELPEVEVLRLSLARRLPGRRVRSVVVRNAALREPIDPAALRSLTGAGSIAGLRRRAKYLLVDFEAGTTLVVHLGMSGRLTVAAEDAPIERHEHVALGLDGGERLRFVDPRRFGLVFAVSTGGLETDRHLAHLGVEPLGSAFDGGYLAKAAQGRRGPVKTFLMDGSVVVGVGNIYASEALWRARVHPRRSVSRISAATWERLVERVRAVLADAIAQGGTTLSDFADGDGNSGYFQVTLAAYGREGEACRRCGRTIRRLVQANRSTFYCPGCQR